MRSNTELSSFSLWDVRTRGPRIRSELIQTSKGIWSAETLQARPCARFSLLVLRHFRAVGVDADRPAEEVRDQFRGRLGAARCKHELAVPVGGRPVAQAVRLELREHVVGDHD